MLKVKRFGSRSQRGMSLIEVMIAGVVFMVGMLGTALMITWAFGNMKSAEEEAIAKQKARQIMESIYGARNSGQFSWPTINPYGAPDPLGSGIEGKFKTGWQAMYNAGLDGVYGTDDDEASGIEVITMENGKQRSLADFQRQITISDFKNTTTNETVGSLRQLKVEVRYPQGNSGLMSTYTIYSLISQYK